MKSILDKRALAYLKPHMGWIMASFGLSFLFAAANVYFLPLTEDIIQAISSKKTTFFHNQIANLLGLVFVRISASKGLMYLMNKIGTQLSMDIRLKLYGKLLQFSQHFYSQWKLGDLISRLYPDIEKLKEGIIMLFKDLLPQVITFFAVLIYMMTTNWKLTTFTLISVPVFIAIIPKLTTKLKKAHHNAQKKVDDMIHVTQEIVGEIKLVQAYNMEDKEIKRLEKINKRNRTAFLRGIFIRIKVEYIIEFLQYAVMTGVIWFGGYEVTNGNLKGEELAAFFMGILLLIDPIITLSKVYTKLNVANVSAERIFEIETLPILIENSPNPKTPETITGKITFKNVSFLYEDNTDMVLKDVSIEAEPGKIIALVGLSGAGKSTLINLIPRFYDPSKGKILLDNINLKDIDLKHLRQHIAMVPQEDILFRGSILDNIKYGSPKATEDEVIDAAKKAHAWDFINKLPNKLRERIGDRGRNLSGGQRQRISIARAILRDPKILLLDEATSALDAESETLVQKALNTLMSNRTTFVIAHRLSTIMHADNIIVLEKGQIVESGTHKELIKKKGAYANLYQLQFKAS